MARWDKGVDYVAAYQRIVYQLNRDYERAQRLYRPGKKYIPGCCYAAILLIQLKNAARISEAVRAFKEYLVTRKAEVEVQVSKKRKKEYRLMVIPQELLELDFSMCMGLLDRPENSIIDVAKHYARKKLKLNTHSLRYSKITHLLKLNYDSAVIAKITHHSNVNFIKTYTQEKYAHDVLRKTD